MKTVAMFLILLLATAGVAMAQQQPNDPAFLQRATAAVQTQRNQALDAAAVQSARADGIAEELAKAQARIKELEANLPK